MRDVRVALAQISPKLGDVEANLALHVASAERARGDGASVVVFPELSLTGYVLRDQTPEVALAADDPRLAALARASEEVDVVAGFVEEAPGHRYHNAAGYWSGGRLVHLHRKVYLPNYGMFQESRDLAAGERLRAFDAPCGPAGLLICEDLWHPSCAWLLAHQGAEVLFALSSGPTRGAKPGRDVTSIDVWRQLLAVTAQFQTSWIVFVNRVGVEDGLTFGGGSTVVDPFGRTVAALDPLDEGWITVDLEADVLRRARVAYPVLRDESLELVWRELGRLRAERFGLPDAEAAAEEQA